MNWAFVLFVKLIYEMKDNSMIYHVSEMRMVLTDSKTKNPMSTQAPKHGNTEQSVTSTYAFMRAPLLLWRSVLPHATCRWDKRREPRAYRTHITAIKCVIILWQPMQMAVNVGDSSF